MALAQVLLCDPKEIITKRDDSYNEHHSISRVRVVSLRMSDKELQKLDDLAQEWGLNRSTDDAGTAQQ